MSVAPPVIQQHIVATPETCGGQPRIAGTRIRVKDVVVWHVHQGVSPEVIVSKHPRVSLAAVYAALSYYHDNRQQLDADLEADEARFEAEKAKQPSLLRGDLSE